MSRKGREEKKEKPGSQVHDPRVNRHKKVESATVHQKAQKKKQKEKPGSGKGMEQESVNHRKPGQKGKSPCSLGKANYQGLGSEEESEKPPRIEQLKDQIVISTEREPGGTASPVVGKGKNLVGARI